MKNIFSEHKTSNKIRRNSQAEIQEIKKIGTCEPTIWGHQSPELTAHCRQTADRLNHVFEGSVASRHLLRAHQQQGSSWTTCLWELGPQWGPSYLQAIWVAQIITYSEVVLRWPWTVDNRYLAKTHKKSTLAKDHITLGLKLFLQVSFESHAQHTKITGQKKRQHDREPAATTGPAVSAGLPPGSLVLGQPAAESPTERLPPAGMKLPSSAPDWAWKHPPQSGLQMTVASRLIATSWESLSHSHSAKLLLNSWSQKVWDNKAVLSQRARGDWLHGSRELTHPPRGRVLPICTSRHAKECFQQCRHLSQHKIQNPN